MVLILSIETNNFTSNKNILTNKENRYTLLLKYSRENAVNIEDFIDSLISIFIKVVSNSYSKDIVFIRFINKQSADSIYKVYKSIIYKRKAKSR